ncbi:hypothetical protein TNCV_556591 [Trichonephila clavipes]|uniref:Uncharacterized protein n=1 Tax=Trichonephila clavipes TaxID=2585209 RepID=A0A8X6V8P6_TRICX|nr:hypothetical protein TNCV_556591 [Trichonephila clavipes]
MSTGGFLRDLTRIKGSFPLFLEKLNTQQTFPGHEKSDKGPSLFLSNVSRGLDHSQVRDRLMDTWRPNQKKQRR